VKEELLHSLPGKECCLKAELAAYIQGNGVLSISSGKSRLEISSENTGLMRRLFALFKKAGVQPQVLYRRQVRLKKNKLYLVQLAESGSIKKMVSWLGYPEPGSFLLNHSLPQVLLKKRCCRRSYLGALFIVRGFLSSPNQTYHMELLLVYEEFALQVAKMMQSFNLHPRVLKRRQGYMVYLKGAEQIAEFLRVIGAFNALLQFENTRIVKEMRNQVNRLVNCETANLKKTVSAAQKQLEAIKLIQERMGLHKLPRSLQVLALVRLKNPEASLKELGELCDPPLGKSGVNHRLRRIEEIAASLYC